MPGFKEDFNEHIAAVYQTAADELKSWFSLLKEIWPLIFLLLLGLLLLLWFAEPAPPKKVMVATGEGSYRFLAEKYKTFFEKKGIAPSIRRSASLFKQTWGETIIGSFGFGIIFFLLALLGIIPIVLGALLGSTIGIVIGVVIAFFYWAIIAVVASATNGIYVAAMYQYATKKELPSDFDPSLIPPPVSGF